MKVFKVKLWRTLTIVTVILAVLIVALTAVANDYSAMVNGFLKIDGSTTSGGSSEEDSQYYKSAYSDLDAMFKDKVSLMREIAQEGSVLLKNEGVLPVKSGKITILGERDFIFSTANGGGAMGSLKSSATTLSAALKYDGITINTDANKISGSEAVIVVLGRVAGEGTDAPFGSLSLTSDEKKRIETAKSDSDNVILLLSGDHQIEIGDYVNDSKIKGIIKFGNAGYRGAYGLADVITGKVSPSGRLVDTYMADTMSAPAMQNFGDYSYGNATFIRASQATNYVSYNEGIYVDYRYYETRYEDCVLGRGNASSSVGAYASNGGWNYSEEVLYPFGYGLSYTTFTREFAGEPVFDDENRTATFKVKVKNTGDVASKEVVQIYAQTPYTVGGVEKSSVQLAGYAKTDTLKPGAEETVEIMVNLQLIASYDYENKKTYVMDAGDYYFAVGNGAHDALNNILSAKGKTISDGMTAEGNGELVYKHTLSKADESYSTSVYTGKGVTNSFEDADINYWVKDSVAYLSRSAWDTTYPETLTLTATSDMLACLSDTKKYENGKWNDTKSRAKQENAEYVDITSASGLEGMEDTLNVVSMRGKDYNDEGWTEILNKLSIYEMSNMVAQGRNYIQALPSVTFPQSTGNDSPIGLNIPYLYYSINPETGETTDVKGKTVTDGITEENVSAEGLTANMYSSEPVLAASFNKELATRQGEMYGEDGLYCGASFVWGLGLNIHRSPYGGRASEYFSADPVLTSKTGAAMSLGAKNKGIVLVAKHFVINEQEDHRIGVATFTNEQALREIYLRAFECVATYGEMQGLMSSYNRIGLISTSAEYDLLTVVLREEWGNNAYVITDLGSPTAGLYDGNASIAAGVSTMMNNGVYDNASGSYVNTTLNIESIKNDPVLLTATREACHRILYNFIHSNAVNGIASDSKVVYVTGWWQPLLIVLEVVFIVFATVSSIMYIFGGIIEQRRKADER